MRTNAAMISVITSTRLTTDETVHLIDAEQFHHDGHLPRRHSRPKIVLHATDQSAEAIMGMFERFGRAVDDIFDEAERALRSAKRSAELRDAAAGALELYFLWGTGWVPAPGAPSTLVDRWWVTARSRLHDVVDTAWAQGRDRKHILAAGLVRQRFLKLPPDPGPMDDRTISLGAMLGIWRHWPELSPPWRAIAPLEIPQPKPRSHYSPTRSHVLGVNQEAYDAHNAFMWQTLQGMQIANQQRFDAQQRWIDRQWRQNHTF